MMMKKIARSLLTILIVCSCAVTAAFAADDITGHWSEPYFRSLSAHGVINANGKGEFTPAAEISRAEFMRYINRAFGFTEQADVSQYKDVDSDQWYYESVRIAVKYGYISGLSSTQMGPDKAITREQAMTILGRLCKIDAGTVTPSQLSFSDKSKIATWSAPYIKWAVDNGYVSGYTDGTFQPQRSVTRAEAAKILYYFTGTILDQAGATYNSSSLNSDTKNVTITSACTLSGVTIPGNLYISEGLNQSAVTLSDVTVKGRLIAAGGTVQLNNVTAPELYISSPFTGREVKVTSAGTTNIDQVTVMTTARLTQTSLQAGASGFKQINVYGDKNMPLTLNGRFGKVSLQDANRLSLSAGAFVESLTVKGAATIEGTGTIQNAVFQANGAVSAIEPQTYSFNKGMSATIQGTSVSVDRSQPNHTLTPATINLSTASDVILAIVSEDNATVRSVMLGDRVLQAGYQYDYDPVTGSIRILSNAFSGLSSGTYTVQVIMSTGINPTATIYLRSGSSSSSSGSSSSSNSGSASLATQAVTFSATAGNAANQNVTINLNIDSSVVVQAVLLDGSQLAMGTQYTISGNQVVLYRTALEPLVFGRTGTMNIVLVLSNGNQLTVPMTLV